MVWKLAKFQNLTALSCDKRNHPYLLYLLPIIIPTHHSGSIAEEEQWMWWACDYIVSRDEFWRTGLLSPLWSTLNYWHCELNKLFAFPSHFCSISSRKIYWTLALCKAVEIVMIVSPSWTQRKSRAPFSTCETLIWIALSFPVSEFSFALVKSCSTRLLLVTFFGLLQISATPTQKNQMKAHIAIYI